MFTSKLAARSALAAVMLAASFAASAALVTSRSALGGNDFIDWGQLPLTDTGTLAQLTPPVNVTSNLGLAGTATNSAGGLYRFNEGDGTYGGNFMTGDKLLTTLFDQGSVAITFASGVARVGAQIEAAARAGAFTAIISVFNSASTLLESYNVSVPAPSAILGDGSASFVGVLRAAADIRSVEFKVSYADPLQDTSVSINQLSLNVTPIPEPTTLALASAGLITLVLVRRRRVKA